MAGGLQTAEVLDFADRVRSRLIAEAPAYAERPVAPFTRGKLAAFVILGLLSWIGLGAMLWGLVGLLQWMGV